MLAEEGRKGWYYYRDENERACYRGGGGGGRGVLSLCMAVVVGP